MPRSSRTKKMSHKAMNSAELHGSLSLADLRGIDNEDLRLKIEKSPVDAVKDLQFSYRQNETTHREQLRTVLSFAYACALRMKNDEAAIRNFYADPLFEQANKPKNDQLLLNTMRFVTGFSAKKYRSAWRYTKALQAKFDVNSSLDEAVVALTQYGVTRLYQEALKADAVSDSAKATRNTRRGSSAVADTLKEDEAEVGAVEPKRNSAAGTTSVERAAKPAQKRSKLVSDAKSQTHYEEVVILASGLRFTKLMDLPRGETVEARLLRLKKNDLKTGYHQFRVIRVTER